MQFGDDWKKLVSFGCDGVIVNLAAGGLKGNLKTDVPWVFMFWPIG